MAKTIEQIRLRLSDVFMSNIDKDDMKSNSADEEEKAYVQQSLKACIDELMGLYAKEILKTTKTTTTVAGQKLYPPVEGQIFKNGVFIAGNTSPLRLEENISLMKEVQGRPYCFNIQPNEEIILYPTPDGLYDLVIQFSDYRYYRTPATITEPQGTPTTLADDVNYINLPERLQAPFEDMVIYRTLANYMRNSLKPRYSATIDVEYARFEKVFLEKLGPIDGTVQFVHTI